MITRRGAVVFLLLAITWFVMPVGADDPANKPQVRFPAKLLQTYRFDDREAVRGVAFLDGAARAAVLQETCLVSIVNLESGRTEQTWCPEDRHCHGGLASSPDGKWLAVACNRRVFLLDTEQLNVRWQTGHVGKKGYFSRVAFSHDGSRLLAAGGGTSTCLCDVATGKMLHNYVPVTGGFSVGTLLFSPDGQYATTSGAVSSGTTDSPVPHGRRWNLSTGEVEFRVELPRRSNVPALWELPDGRLAVHSLDGIKFYTKGTRNESQLYPQPPLTGWQSHISGDRLHYVMATRDGAIHPFDVRAPDASLGSFAAEIMPASGTLNHDGSQLLLGSAHGDVQLWKLDFPEPGTELVTRDDAPAPESSHARIESHATALDQAGFVRFDGHADTILAVAALPDNQHVMTAGSDGRVLLWDILTQRLVKRYQGRGAKNLYFGMAVHPSEDKILLAGGQYRPHQNVAWWDVTSLEKQTPFPGLTNTAFHVAVSSDGNWCAAAGHSQDLVMWNAKTREEKFRVKPRVQRNGLGFFSVEFSSDNKYLMAGSVDTLDVWSVETGLQVTNRKQGHLQIQAIRARPGAEQALVDAGRAAVLMGIPSLQTIRSFPADGHFRCASFSADGMRLAYGGRHVPVRVWDLEINQELYRHEGRADKVTMTPDGERLIVAEATSMLVISLP